MKCPFHSLQEEITWHVAKKKKEPEIHMQTIRHLCSSSIRVYHGTIEKKACSGKEIQLAHDVCIQYQQLIDSIFMRATDGAIL